MKNEAQCKNCIYSVKVNAYGESLCCDYNLVHYTIGDKGKGAECDLFEPKEKRKRKLKKIQDNRVSFESWKNMEV